MTNVDLLKTARDLLLSLHKSLVDFDRAIYEGVHGPTTSGQFLNLLLEDAEFGWLRKFSTLIVDIDEMFAQRDGFEENAVEAHLFKMRDLIGMSDPDRIFRAKYQAALQHDLDALGKHTHLKKLLRIRRK